MHKDENNAIRYLMKEMDPSEEMEFEKQLREDENLLIEVESLRATKKKLSGLPSIHPPKQLTNQIVDEAKQLQSDRVNQTFKLKSTVFRAAAVAVLILSFSALWYYQPVVFSGQSTPTVTNSVSPSAEIEPWVDRNEILRFENVQQAIQGASAQPEFSRSYEKLQLVNDPAGSTTGNGILLTGSSN